MLCNFINWQRRKINTSVCIHKKRENKPRMLRSHNSGAWCRAQHWTTLRHIPEDHKAVLIFTPSITKTWLIPCEPHVFISITVAGTEFHSVRPKVGSVLSVDQYGALVKWQLLGRTKPTLLEKNVKKGKAFRLQAWTGPLVSRRLRLLNF
jgi:hypothetical protein